ncbi:hypothetical protein SDJN02_00608 [Cucurbita argyrosperma subsp. argyrosperma]|nr:hypothetical protein SDJN02_00608 [Cucurbita argyrosperma subsp. argyrosperma]
MATSKKMAALIEVGKMKRVREISLAMEVSKGLCFRSPYWYAIDCYIPNNPFGFCSHAHGQWRKETRVYNLKKLYEIEECFKESISPLSLMQHSMVDLTLLSLCAKLGRSNVMQGNTRDRHINLSNTGFRASEKKNDEEDVKRVLTDDVLVVLKYKINV